MASGMRLLIRHSLTMSHKLNITIYYLLVSFDCASLQWPVTAHFIPSELHYLKVDYNNPGLIPKSRTPSFFFPLPSTLRCRQMQNFTHLALADMRAAPLVEGWGVLVGMSDRAVVPPGAAAGFVVASGFVSLTWPASQSHGAKQQRDGKKIRGASSHIRHLLKIRPLSPPPRPCNGSVHTDTNTLSYHLFLKQIQSWLLIGQYSMLKSII